MYAFPLHPREEEAYEHEFQCSELLVFRRNYVFNSPDDRSISTCSCAPYDSAASLGVFSCRDSSGKVHLVVHCGMVCLEHRIPLITLYWYSLFWSCSACLHKNDLTISPSLPASDRNIDSLIHHHALFGKNGASSH